VQHAVAGGTGGALRAVSCASKTTCMAVGQVDYPESGAPAERWDGTAWSARPIALPVSSDTVRQVDLDAVSCSSATACTAVGSFAPLAGGQYGLVERWDGSTWSVQTPSPGPNRAYLFSGVSCPSRTTCTAVGSKPRGMWANDILIERWSAN
jgi:hypothetical protein